MLLSINYFWALPRIPKDPPGDSDASPDSAVALSVGKASLSGWALPTTPLVSQFSQSVQFSWFRGTSRASDFHGFLKGPRGDNETWPFGPILKALVPSDAADREDLQLSPQIRNFSPSVGTSEICDFQFYANSLVFWPRPVASVRGVDLDDREVVAEKIVAGNFSQPTCCCLLTTWHAHPY